MYAYLTFLHLHDKCDYTPTEAELSVNFLCLNAGAQHKELALVFRGCEVVDLAPDIFFRGTAILDYLRSPFWSFPKNANEK